MVSGGRSRDTASSGVGPTLKLADRVLTRPGYGDEGGAPRMSTHTHGRALGTASHAGDCAAAPRRPRAAGGRRLRQRARTVPAPSTAAQAHRDSRPAAGGGGGRGDAPCRREPRHGETLPTAARSNSKRADGGRDAETPVLGGVHARTAHHAPPLTWGRSRNTRGGPATATTSQGHAPDTRRPATPHGRAGSRHQRSGSPRRRLEQCLVAATGARTRVRTTVPPASAAA